MYLPGAVNGECGRAYDAQANQAMEALTTARRKAVNYCTTRNRV